MNGELDGMRIIYHIPCVLQYNACCWAKRSSTIVPCVCNDLKILKLWSLHNSLNDCFRLQVLFWNYHPHPYHVQRKTLWKTGSLLQSSSIYWFCGEGSFLNLESSSRPARKIAHKFSATGDLSMWFPCEDILQTTCNQKTTIWNQQNPPGGKGKSMNIIFKSALGG